MTSSGKVLNRLLGCAQDWSVGLGANLVVGQVMYQTSKGKTNGHHFEDTPKLASVTGKTAMNEVTARPGH